MSPTVIEIILLHYFFCVFHNAGAVNLQNIEMSQKVTKSEATMKSECFGFAILQTTLDLHQ